MKYLPIIKYALLILSVLAVILGIMSNVDIMMLWAYLILFVTIALTIIMPLIGVLQNPQAAKGGLVGLVAILLVFGVSYLLASDEAITLASGAVIDSKGALIFSDTALFATYITFAGVIVSIIGSEIYKSFK